MFTTPGWLSHGSLVCIRDCSTPRLKKTQMMLNWSPDTTTWRKKDMLWLLVTNPSVVLHNEKGVGKFLVAVVCRRGSSHHNWSGNGKGSWNFSWTVTFKDPPLAVSILHLGPVPYKSYRGTKQYQAGGNQHWQHEPVGRGHILVSNPNTCPSFLELEIEIFGGFCNLM